MSAPSPRSHSITVSRVGLVVSLNRPDILHVVAKTETPSESFLFTDLDNLSQIPFCSGSISHLNTSPLPSLRRLADAISGTYTSPAQPIWDNRKQMETAVVARSHLII